MVDFAAGEERGDVRAAAFDTNVLKQVATVIENLKAEYGGVVSEESIDLVAGESLQKLAGSKVPQFVPLFVARFTRERLQELTGLRPRARLNKVPEVGIRSIASHITENCTRVHQRALAYDAVRRCGCHLGCHNARNWRGWMRIELTRDASQRPANGFEDRVSNVCGRPPTSA
jgi:hypothetical protein